MSSVEIPLSYPVTFGGKTHSSLSMRRPKLRDEMAIDKQRKTDAAGAEVTLFCNLCEVEREVILELDMLDYGKVQETYSGFTKAAPQA